jgi:hypothetical protein
MPLLFVKENGQRTEQGKIACAHGVADGATVFILGAITAKVLAVLDAPMHARPAQELLWIGFIGPQAGDQKSHFGGFLDDFALADSLNVPFDPD